MRRLALAVLALALAPVAAASEQRPTLSELEPELVCPTCRSTLDMSNSPVAERMRAFIRERIAAGDTKSEIKAELVAQFGPGVLSEPPKEGFDLLAWLLPLAAVGLGAAVLGLAAWRWTRGRDGPAAAPAAGAALDPDSERRVDEALRAYDG